MPFREAHEVVAKAVRFAADKSVDLSGLSLVELQRFSTHVEADAFDVLTLEGSLKARNHPGGTAPEQVRAALTRARAELGDLT